MLNLDIARLSAAELKETVSDHCSPFGTVKSIKIRGPDQRRNHAIAAVEMSTPIEADRVVVEIGDLKFGSTAIVRLMQEGQPIPISIQYAGTTFGRNAPIEILLVEDNPADARMTQEALKAAGVQHRLHVVENGLEAISFLYRTRQFNNAPEPDVVLLDLNIPKLNGHEVLREIKTNDDFKHIPVVVLTCSNAENDSYLSFEANADRYVTKPEGLDAFAEEMKKVEALATR
jgi:two-component system, chemotaxis family, response regulator Rcp1